MYELIIREKAQQQILDIFSYYEDIQEGLGDRFEKELDSFLDKIEQNPKQYQAVDKVFRRAHLKIFPYTLFYFRVETIIFLVSVWSQAGKEGRWREEVDEF